MITKKNEQEFKKPKLFKIWSLLIYGSSIAIGFFLVYLYSAYVFINRWPTCMASQLLMELLVFYCLVDLLSLLLKLNANLIDFFDP